MAIPAAIGVWELGALAAGGLATLFAASPQGREAAEETARAAAEALERLRPDPPETDAISRAKARRRAASSSGSESMPETTLRLVYQERLILRSDTYLMRSANRPGQLLVSADYDRVLHFDLARRTMEVIPFPRGVRSFGIYSWLVAPDGSASYLISGDQVDFGLRLDHEQGTATRFYCPYESGSLTEFCWQTPQSLQIFDYAGRIRTFDPIRGIVYASVEVLEQEPTRTYLRLRPEWSPTKAANYGQGVYVSGREQTRIGYVPPSLSLQDALLVPQDADAIDVTHYRDNVFVCYEEGIEQHVGGAMRIVLEPPPGRDFIGVNVVIVDEQPLLCVLGATLRTLEELAVRNGFIALYRLLPGPGPTINPPDYDQW